MLLTCVVLYYISYFHFADDIHGQVSFWFLLVSGGSQRTTICPHSDKHAKSSGTVKDGRNFDTGRIRDLKRSRDSAVAHLARPRLATTELGIADGMFRFEMIILAQLRDSLDGWPLIQ